LQSETDTCGGNHLSAVPRMFRDGGASRIEKEKRYGVKKGATVRLIVKINPDR